MGESNDEPTPPDALSEALIQRVDALELSELKALKSYTSQRIDTLQTPIVQAIEANAAGEVLDIEDHGSYAIVRMHPPNPDSASANSEITSIYHVRLEPHLDDTESLHWAYLGDIHDGGQPQCDDCGRTLDENVDSCPNCGSDDINNADSGQ